jgi:hypothetical protein
MSDQNNNAAGLPDDTETLLFETSPFGNIDAIVEHNGQTVYFYLNERLQSENQQPRFGTRACWVRNLVEGPLVLNADAMQDGSPPVLPRIQTLHRAGQPLPDRNRLSIVWFEEGNGAALVESPSPLAAGELEIKTQQPASNDHKNPPEQELGKVLAVIPPWSGQDGFHGYAAECATENPVCWPLPPNPALVERIRNAVEFWDQFTPEKNPFGTLQKQRLAYYETRFGNPKAVANSIGNQQYSYFAIDGSKFPPRGLVEFKSDAGTILATVGLSLLPQPMVEMNTQTPTDLRRIELAIALPAAATQLQIDTAKQNISRLAAYPWSQFTWLGAGHTCSFVGIRPECNSAILIDDSVIRTSSHPMANGSQIEGFRGDKVNLLWIFPVTNADQQGMQTGSVTAAKISNRAIEASSEWLAQV